MRELLHVRQMKYSIGYVEYAHAKQNQFAWISLQNQAGQFVQPSNESFMAAASHAKWHEKAGMGVILTNETGGKILANYGGEFYFIK